MQNQIRKSNKVLIKIQMYKSTTIFYDSITIILKSIIIFAAEILMIQK